MASFDVQLMGAVVLHQGKIAEMATGEGSLRLFIKMDISVLLSRLQKVKIPFLN